MGGEGGLFCFFKKAFGDFFRRTCPVFPEPNMSGARTLSFLNYDPRYVKRISKKEKNLGLAGKWGLLRKGFLILVILQVKLMEWSKLVGNTASGLFGRELRGGGGGNPPSKEEGGNTKNEEEMHPLRFVFGSFSLRWRFELRKAPLPPSIRHPAFFRARLLDASAS